jgi:hypothetical protein
VAIGSVYAALERLEDKGFVTSELGEATPERGGRAKRYFQVTARGLKEVRETQRALVKLWHGLPELPYNAHQACVRNFSRNHLLFGKLSSVGPIIGVHKLDDPGRMLAEMAKVASKGQFDERLKMFTKRMPALRMRFDEITVSDNQSQFIDCVVIVDSGIATIGGELCNFFGQAGGHTTPPLFLITRSTLTFASTPHTRRACFAVFRQRSLYEQRLEPRYCDQGDRSRQNHESKHGDCVQTNSTFLATRELHPYLIAFLRIVKPG